MTEQEVPVSRGYTPASNPVNQMFFRRRKTCPLSEAGSLPIDYKNIKLLVRFISERGRILPSRITSVSTAKQRLLQTAIKRARILALFPFAQK